MESFGDLVFKADHHPNFFHFDLFSYLDTRIIIL